MQRCVIDSISQQCRQRRDSSSSPVAAATASASISPEKESTSAKKLQVTSQEALNGFMTALALASKVTSGKEAVALLCDSWRVREDLQSVRHFMQYGMKICLVVRHWNQVHPSFLFSIVFSRSNVFVLSFWNIKMLAENPQREFRGFVCHNQLTALSQYDHKVSCVDVDFDVFFSSFLPSFSSFSSLCCYLLSAISRKFSRHKIASPRQHSVSSIPF